MMTSISKVSLTDKFPKLSTREIGREARVFIIDTIHNSDVVEIDLSGVLVTPSFADECFGMIAEEFGRDIFKKKIKLKNVANDSSRLLKHVIMMRTQRKNQVMASTL